MRQLALFTILVFMLAGCTSDKISFDYATYTYSEFGITFKYPKEWSVKDDTAAGNFILALSKEGKGFTDGSSVLFYGTKPKDMNFMNRTLEEDEETRIIEDKQMMINDQPARLVTTEADDDSGVKLLIFYVVFEEEDKSLMVTSGEMEEKSAEYDMFFDIISTIELSST
ncbi:PsbP-related protein [Paenibacillus sanguinis]|uniref:PsbP-related protein n=1 Tax=Paenibacillus sanguinis TaxID=225906 RepID=UPI000379975F|nr:PsbP-related protein [Paenibacillus sanguinis]